MNMATVKLNLVSQSFKTETSFVMQIAPVRSVVQDRKIPPKRVYNSGEKNGV